METEDLAIKFEAQLVSTSMTNSGGHKITLRVNPEDILDSRNLSSERSMLNNRVRSLFTSPTSTRYICVLVQLEDESDKPVVPVDVEEAKQAINTLSMLCRSNQDWHRWIENELGQHVVFGPHDTDDPEMVTLDQVKKYLGITSRKDLIKNLEAVKKFNSLYRRFQNE